MLCYSLLYSKVTQLYIYIYPLFFRFSQIGHDRVLSSVPCARTVDFEFHSVDDNVTIAKFWHTIPSLLPHEGELCSDITSSLLPTCFSFESL